MYNVVKTAVEQPNKSDCYIFMYYCAAFLLVGNFLLMQWNSQQKNLDLLPSVGHIQAYNMPICLWLATSILCLIEIIF